MLNTYVTSEKVRVV